MIQFLQSLLYEKESDKREIQELKAKIKVLQGDLAALEKKDYEKLIRNYAKEEGLDATEALKLWRKL